MWAKDFAYLVVGTMEWSPTEVGECSLPHAYYIRSCWSISSLKHPIKYSRGLKRRYIVLRHPDRGSVETNVVLRILPQWRPSQPTCALSTLCYTTESKRSILVWISIWSDENSFVHAFICCFYFLLFSISLLVTLRRRLLKFPKLNDWMGWRATRTFYLSHFFSLGICHQPGRHNEQISQWFGSFKEPHWRVHPLSSQY